MIAEAARAGMNTKSLKKMIISSNGPSQSLEKEQLPRRKLQTKIKRDDLEQTIIWAVQYF